MTTDLGYEYGFTDVGGKIIMKENIYCVTCMCS